MGDQPSTAPVKRPLGITIIAILTATWGFVVILNLLLIFIITINGQPLPQSPYKTTTSSIVYDIIAAPLCILVVYG